MFFVLIGNKCELKDQREVPTEEARLFADNHKMLFFETSAKENINVSKSFETIVSIIIEKIKDGSIDPYNEALGVKVGFNSINQDFL